VKKRCFYNQEYFENGNYKGYTKGWYRIWHYFTGYAVGLYLKTKGVKRVLDFGCADGVMVAAMRKLGIEAWGVDKSEYAISKAPNEAKNYVWCGQIKDMSFGPRYFDMVTSWDVLEHIPPDDIEPVIKDIVRVGKKGLWGIYTKDETIAKLHKALGKTHDDHVSEHDSCWWTEKFEQMGIKWKRLMFYRKGTFLLEFANQSR